MQWGSLELFPGAIIHAPARLPACQDLFWPARPRASELRGSRQLAAGQFPCETLYPLFPGPFVEATKSGGKANSAHEAIAKIAQFYQIEHELRDAGLSEKGFSRQRKERILPLAKEFKGWLDKKVWSIRPTCATGQAVAYAVATWDKVMKYLESPHLTPDNNGAENAIRPFVLGRKNWLFSGSPTGAESSCFMFSLIETARQNGLNPYGYLVYVFPVDSHIKLTVRA